MKECERIKRLLSAYLDKETSGAQTSFVGSHLEQCPSCRRELMELSRVKEFLLEKKRLSLPPDYLVSRVRQEISRQYRVAQESVSWLAGVGKFSLRLIPVPVTAIALAMVLLFSGAPRRSGESSLEDTLLNGKEVTVEMAMGVILGTVD